MMLLQGHLLWETPPLNVLLAALLTSVKTNNSSLYMETTKAWSKDGGTAEAAIARSAVFSNAFMTLALKMAQDIQSIPPMSRVSPTQQINPHQAFTPQQ